MLRLLSRILILLDITLRAGVHVVGCDVLWLMFVLFSTAFHMCFMFFDRMSYTDPTTVPPAMVLVFPQMGMKRRRHRDELCMARRQ